MYIFFYTYQLLIIAVISIFFLSQTRPYMITRFSMTVIKGEAYVLYSSYERYAIVSKYRPWLDRFFLGNLGSAGAEHGYTIHTRDGTY